MTLKQIIKNIVNDFFIISMFLILFSNVLYVNYVWAETITVDDDNIWTDTVEQITGGPDNGIDRAYYPSVIKVDNTYHLWYGDGTNTRHVTSNKQDFKNTVFAAPVVTGLTSGVYHPFVLHIESGLTIDGSHFDGPFFMYATNSNSWNSPPILYHSINGDDWSEIGSLTGVNEFSSNETIYNFAVVFENMTSWKAYADNGHGYVVYYASTDGLNWTGVSENILGNSIQSWETTNNTRPFVIKVGNYYVMFYGNGASNNKAIGMAVSTDGENFIKSNTNPIFSTDDSVDWRDERTYTPTIIKDDNEYVMYFSGKSQTTSNYSLGYATNQGLFWDIQDAINAASNNDVIDVASGTYNITSTITLDKSISLFGAQANKDPRSDSNTQRSKNNVDESIIDGQGILGQLLMIDASNVQINGFEIRNGTGDLIKSDEGIVKGNPVIKYNIIHGSSGDEGIQLKSVDDAIIEFNHVYDTGGDGINIAISHNGIIQHNEVNDIRSPDAAIYVYNDGQRDFINATIQNNLVYNIHNNDGIKVGSKSGADDSLHGGSVLNNIIHDIRQDGISIYTSNTIVDGNEVYNSASENGAVYISWNSNNITVTNNNIHNNKASYDTGTMFNDPSTTYGIRIGKTTFPTNVTINNNIIQGNESGIFYNFNEGNPPLNATNNYWGSSKGPTHSTNPDGNGDSVNDNILFEPWYLNSKLSNISSEKIGNSVKSTENNVKLGNNGASEGKAVLPDDVNEIILGDDTVLDLSTNTSSSSDNEDGDIVIDGETKTLKTFTSGSLTNIDLKTSQQIGDKQITVKKAVKIASGLSNTPIKIKNTNLSNVEISIPDDSTVLGPDSWTGSINPPKTTTKSGTAPSGFSIGNTVIEVGSKSEILLFDNPVTITLSGVTGVVGYKPAGSENWKQITNQCSGTFDNPGSPPFPEECFISNEADTKIVTFHFTVFGSLNEIAEQQTVLGGSSGDRTEPVLKLFMLSSDNKMQDQTSFLEHPKELSKFNVKEPIEINLSFYENSGPSSMQHVAIYTNIQEPYQWYNSKSYVEWDKDGPLIIKNEDSLFDTVNATSIIDGDMFNITFQIKFAQPMMKSDVVLYFWDYKRNGVFAEFDDMLTIVDPQEALIEENTDNDLEQYAEYQNSEPIIIPSWIKNIAGQWSEDQFDDSTFVDSLEYLIQEKIITVQEHSADNPILAESEIPKWIKNNARWWSEDRVSDEEFINAIKWFIVHKIIKI